MILAWASPFKELTPIYFFSFSLILGSETPLALEVPTLLKPFSHFLFVLQTRKFAWKMSFARLAVIFTNDFYPLELVCE